MNKEGFKDRYNEFINKNKPTLVVVGFLVIILLAIMVPTLIIDSKQNKEKAFPGYDSTKITEKTVENNYNGIKEQLQNDKYFTKITKINDFNSNSYEPSKLQNLLWYYMFNFEISNNKYFTTKYSDEYIYCMRESRVIEGFQELYGVDISSDVSLLPGYYKYVYQKGKSEYCFNFDQIAKEYDATIQVGVERLAMTGTRITTDVYVYEYYNDESETTTASIEVLNSKIKSNDWNGAKEVVTKLGGIVTHKQLTLSQKPNGKFFKYRLFSIKTLNN